MIVVASYASSANTVSNLWKPSLTGTSPVAEPNVTIPD